MVMFDCSGSLYLVLGKNIARISSIYHAEAEHVYFDMCDYLFSSFLLLSSWGRPSSSLAFAQCVDL